MSSKEFSRKTFEWLYQVIADPELPAACTKIAVRLTYHFNEEDGGRAFPGYKCIADAIGVSERIVERSVQQMHARGHLRVTWGSPGRGHPNQYWMILKPALEPVLDHVKPAPARVLDHGKPAPARVLDNHKTRISGQENPHFEQIKPAPVRENHKTNHKGEPHVCAEPPVLNLDLNQQQIIDFDRFWSVYPKQVGKPATKRAFKKALEKAPAEEIIAGAVRYASDPARLAQSRGPEGDRFTKSPANWLDDERWTDKLAVGNTVDEHGNPIAVPQQQEDIEDDDDIIARTMRDYPDGGQRWH